MSDRLSKSKEADKMGAILDASLLDFLDILVDTCHAYILHFAYMHVFCGILNISHFVDQLRDFEKEAEAEFQTGFVVQAKGYAMPLESEDLHEGNIFARVSTDADVLEGFLKYMVATQYKYLLCPLEYLKVFEIQISIHHRGLTEDMC